MRFLIVAAGVLLADSSVAETFYPVTDINGHVHLVQGQDGGKRAGTEPAVAPAQEKVQDPQPVNPAPTVRSSSEKMPAARDHDGDSAYQNSEDLEKNGYRPKEKQRFYFFSDHSMGLTPIVSDNGIPVVATPQPVEGDDVARPSAHYREVAREALAAEFKLPIACLGKRQLRHAFVFKGGAPILISEPLTGDTGPDYIANLGGDGAPVAFRLRSYASTSKAPRFYLPVPVFLDKSGCVLTGAWSYWTNQAPSTPDSHAMIEGLLLAPSAAAYIVFYRPAPSLALPVDFGYPGSLMLESFQ